MAANGTIGPISRLDHVGVNVPDLSVAVSFFVEVFGARVVFEIPRLDNVGGALERLGADQHARLALAMLEIGQGWLELLEWTPAQPATSGMLGVAHVAIAVEDLSGALDALRRTDGVAVIGEPVEFQGGPTPGLANAFAMTPWGLLIELVCWATRPA